jgi:aromatase
MTKRESKRTVAGARTVNTTHTIFIAAPPKTVYDLIADAGRWPYIFTPTVHVQRLYGTGTSERLRLWAVANGAVRSWISQRTMDPRDLRIRFRQESPAAPIASMAGEWVFVPLPDNATSVVLLHKFRAVDDDPGNIALITQAVDRNSTAELAALKTTAELGKLSSKLVYSFANSMTIASDPGPVYEFLYRAREWPERLPHVNRLILDEAVPNVQTIEMDTCELDGSVNTARLVRVCFPYESIAYKQTEPPELMSAHIGRWRMYPVADGVRVTSHNTVMIRPDRVRRLLGGDATIEQAYQLIREALSNNNWITLRQAKHAIEGGSEEHLDQVPARPSDGAGRTPASIMQVD